MNKTYTKQNMKKTILKQASILRSVIFGTRASAKRKTPVSMIIPKMTAIHTSSIENVQTQAAEIDTEMSVNTWKKDGVKKVPVCISSFLSE